jgi:Ca2+-transporting ATPase
LSPVYRNPTSKYIKRAGIALVPLLFDWPLILTLVRVVFLEPIIDPGCSIAFEAEPEQKPHEAGAARSQSTALRDARYTS